MTDNNLSPEEKLIQIWETDYPLKEWLEGEDCDIWCGDYYITVVIKNARNCEYFMQDNQLHLKFTADAVIYKVATDKNSCKLGQWHRKRFFTFDIHINISEIEAHKGDGIEDLELYNFGDSVSVIGDDQFYGYTLDLKRISDSYIDYLYDAIYSLYSDDLVYFDW